MVDDQKSGDESAPFRCPWCSAVLPASDLETCPSCNAALTGTAEAALPGVTAIDHEAIARGTREAIRQPRSRLLSWLSGEYTTEAPPATGAIAPPDLAVRREILRLQIEAEIADRQAEADSIMADAAVEGRPFPGLPGTAPEGEAPAEEAELESDATPVDAAASAPVPAGESAQEAPAPPEPDAGSAPVDSEVDRPA